MFARQSNRPTHRVYLVSKTPACPPSYLECGGAWIHIDGAGFDLRFTLQPAEGALIVVRAMQAEGAAQ